jgi:antirepressor regulating drug resistance (membrane-bound), putative
LVLFLSLLFAALKTKISVKVKYFIWFLILLSFLFPFRPKFGSGFIRLSTGATVQTAVRASQTSGGQAVSQVTEKASQANLWESFLGLPWFEIFFVI